ncbi:hypothetical protein ACA910_008107 [Epithemia clementina (nom. ined.)]
MWNSFEAGGSGGGSGSAMTSSVTTTSATLDPATFWMNTQLASALSMTGDAQYWEESISPNTIRQSLAEADPSNPSSTPSTLRGMKWLLASISKGRNVSDFYPHVVKLVGAVSLEVRKMVYMYLVQYADHDATTRELSLLSINSFQRGLADPEQWIRALALRVLTSIRIPDILQIQILGVQKCAQDRSPYVRKCAANAIAKLHPRCRTTMDGILDASADEGAQQQQDLLLQICHDLLLHDQATMVLTSALIAWQELCPDRLEMLHGCFRKFCHLLTDMDEWGQVVVIDTFARYCRKYFAEPAGWRDGSAERIDRERRVRRTIYGLENETYTTTTHHQTPTATTFTSTNMSNVNSTTTTPTGSLPLSTADQAALAGISLPPRIHHNSNHRAPSGLPVVRKGFYSDEEDDDADGHISSSSNNNINNLGTIPRAIPGGGVGTATLPALQSQTRNVMGLKTANHEMSPFASSGALDPSPLATAAASSSGSQLPLHQNTAEDSDLAEDHRLFLNAAMHLLKSRNAGVVLAVCSLQYYCGVSSIQVRVAMGKALVRIHRDLREIQYVVLASIRTLASECPSAFSPFLSDFFVQSSLDPPFTRLIKLDILTSLALEPAAIDTVLQEMRTYVRHGDVRFARASIRAVGRVVELARIVYDRHAAKTSGLSEKRKQRAQANTIALNALHGLLTLTQVPQPGNRAVAGEAVLVMRLVLQLLQQDCEIIQVHDPNRVQERSIQRMLFLLIKTLATRIALSEDAGDDEEDDDDDEEGTATTALDAVACFDLPEEAAAAAIWVVGDHLADLNNLSSSSSQVQPFRGDATVRNKTRLELVRMLVRAFPALSNTEKEQGIHLASKLIVSRLTGGATSNALPGEEQLCELLLAMGRVDVNTDVRDRARFESGLLRSVSALKHDLDALDEYSVVNKKQLTLDHVKKILLHIKPAGSSLPVENYSNSHALESDAGFRFGTISSLLGHQARSAYIPLPPWAEKDSPSSLRVPPSPDRKAKDTTPASIAGGGGGTTTGQYSDVRAQSAKQNGGFYGSSSDDDESSDDDDDSSSDGSSDKDSSDDEDAGDASPSASNQAGIQAVQSQPMTMTQAPKVQLVADDDDSTDDDEEEEEDDDDDDSTDDDDDKPSSALAGTKTTTSGTLISLGNGTQAETTGYKTQQQNGFGAQESSIVDDMRGLVLAPIVSDSGANNATLDVERNSSDWIRLVRAEHASGLSVIGRFLRGPDKDKEVQLLGLKPKPTLVFLQLVLESKATSAQVFRRIKWLPRPLGGSSSFLGPKNIFFPPEIDQLKPGQRSECVLGMEFPSLSDRDGALLAKFDFRYGSGNMPVEIKPTLGDLLLPCDTSSQTTSKFDDEMKRLQGFQRVETTVDVSSSSGNEGLSAKLERAILKAAALTVLGLPDGNVLRLMGLLPASNDPVYVKVTRLNEAKYQITICSENALSANSLINLLKKKVQTSL